MRPRPDAAENCYATLDHPRYRRASMRPRPDAAENLLAGVLVEQFTDASMRPRPDAAENFHGMLLDLLDALGLQ